MRFIIKIIKKWLPLAIATAGLCVLVYLTVQQSLRMGANDPQIQMAEDAASQLNAGASVKSVLPPTKVEIADSLAPFVMVFDESGKVLASSATLHGAVPDLSGGCIRLRAAKWPRPGDLATRTGCAYGNRSRTL